MPNRRYRIAVIGGGPKGMYGLDCLAKELEASNSGQVEVHIFEPHPVPGAGPVYDVGQPHFLRLNYPNSMVNMWAEPSDGLSLVQWLDRFYPAFADPIDSAPRAIVGEYLADGYRTIADRLARVADVHTHATKVNRVKRHHARWLVRAANTTEVEVDSVLVTTGHCSRLPSTSGLEGPAYIDSVYPVERLEAVTPGSTVAIRGMGLTAIDAILALTEGRGGKFEGSGSIPHYQTSGLEPARIVPYSRSGLAMTSKPRHPATINFEAAAEQLRTSLAESSNPAITLREFLACKPGQSRAGKSNFSSTSPATPASITRDVRMAYGEVAQEFEHQVGARWRGVYKTIVDAVEQRQLDHCWPEFAALEVEMERLAFGPPASNAARIASIARSGLVDFTYCKNPTVVRRNGQIEISSGGESITPDVLVNAVIPGPGLVGRPTPLIGRLIADGHARTDRHHGGVEIDSAANAVGASGMKTPGLSFIGRMTHGSTIGNDTLSRTLHDHPRRWARACVSSIEGISNE